MQSFKEARSINILLSKAFEAISESITEYFSPCLKRIFQDTWNSPEIREYLVRVHPELKEDYQIAVTDVIDIYVGDLVYTELLRTISHLKAVVDREKSYLVVHRVQSLS